eukprot:3772469-Prymnesium_polylepis.1
MGPRGSRRISQQQTVSSMWHASTSSADRSGHMCPQTARRASGCVAERAARARASRGVACVGGWEGVAAAPCTAHSAPAHLRPCLPL